MVAWAVLQTDLQTNGFQLFSGANPKARKNAQSAKFAAILGQTLGKVGCDSTGIQAGSESKLFSACLACLAARARHMTDSVLFECFTEPGICCSKAVEPSKKQHTLWKPDRQGLARTNSVRRSFLLSQTGFPHTWSLLLTL